MLAGGDRWWIDGWARSDAGWCRAAAFHHADLVDDEQINLAKRSAEFRLDEWSEHRQVHTAPPNRIPVRGVTNDNGVMMQPAIRSVLAVLLLSCFAISPAQVTTPSCPAVTPIEATHLVEARVKDLSITAVRATVNDGAPAYIVEGTVGRDGYLGVVDARVARTLSITRNGAAFYEWPGIVAVGHRGTVRFAPENTIAAFEKAIDFGLDLIEIDVRETADGHLVIIHDATVNRTTNGAGRVSELTLSQIKKLDAGSWFDPSFKGERVPTLEEALEAMRGRALPDIDFRAGTPEKLVAAVRSYGLLGKVTLYCGDWDLLQQTLKVSPDFRARPTVPNGRVGLPVLIRHVGPPIVNINWKEFTEPLVREVHLAGREAFLNTMGPNDTEFGILRAIDAGADYIQSDRPDILMPLLRARGLHK